MPKPERHVLVCLNERPRDSPRGSCAHRGAEEVFERLKKAAKEAGLGKRVIVNRTGCLKHCSEGVAIAVYPESTWYARVTVGDVDDICRTHLLGGQVVERLQMPDIPWE